MKKGLYTLLILIISLSLVQCAQRGSPTGGEVDIEPPVFLRASPENYSTNFDRDEIRIFFNEYIKLEQPQQQIIISPPMDPKPVITPSGSPQRYIGIEITDTLQENTTYVINFGNSVVDNNENNPLPFFKYVFSTGAYIDSLTLSGTVTDALLKEPDPFISVMLYEINENFSDSLIFNEPPRYITNTLDSLTSFELTNLKEGTYQLVALKDLNNDYKYNPGKEKIAFIEEPVTIPTENSYNLVLFRENQLFQPERPKQLKQNKLLIPYTGIINPDSLSVEPITQVSEDFKYKITKMPEKDSLYLWLSPPVQRDSLRFKLISKNREDTLFTRLIDMPLDSLEITAQPSGNIGFEQNIFLNASTPLVEKDDALISIMNNDSVIIEYTSQLLPYENSVSLNFEKTENQNYNVTILPGALTDFYGATNDTIIKSFKTGAFSEYGNITLNLQNVKSYPIIVQLTDENGVVKAEKYSTSQSNLRFALIAPGKYLVRVIYDRNENEVWDTGDYLQKRNPEEIVYLPKVLDVRPNWDIIEPFILN